MTIAVAVSGGMDSLLALALLKERGEPLLAVHGHFLPPSPAWETVTTGLAGACAVLGVPFHALDLHASFDDRVIKPFVAEYKAGLTPNPCAMCNPRMKFGVLFDAARNLGAERLATGHYVSMEDRAQGRMLVRGADQSKDQSYFLSMVPVEKLRLAEFPLARTLKRDVPAVLAAHGLTPPLKAESQEICFVPDDDYQHFLTSRGDMPGPGPAVLPDGRVVGGHQGLWRHTQGQRRGLGIAWSEPLYVLEKDVPGNTLIVGPKEFLAAKGCVAGQVNLMCPVESWPGTVLVQTRYRQKAKPARVRLTGGRLYFDFLEPHTRPTPGQVAAVYDESGTVLGGGVIEKAL
ncbi:tRNA (5-methylaminomethyl-2-thiouridylate)-methyltransferase [Pseudodesulfovibrio mercurii]|uniref:tRNA-specific 2-thiouridylase MnmA n=1 Tax=Pseudodesulfovibrio mercurii TaxID=641491 RepID=F0JKU9_9BACT|nr:tRNA 2-thiouridine(34) synthase MnmA [Pseudodesulfovibrio mercurii]EGB16548.1 tRNA (5-methylaminomethyl-2-thiouridylate)-methyltransferase [Pseudodesulfovibrio mercurii]